MRVPASRQCAPDVITDTVFAAVAVRPQAQVRKSVAKRGIPSSALISPVQVTPAAREHAIFPIGPGVRDCGALPQGAQRLTPRPGRLPARPSEGCHVHPELRCSESKRGTTRGGERRRRAERRLRTASANSTVRCWRPQPVSSRASSEQTRQPRHHAFALLELARIESDFDVLELLIGYRPLVLGHARRAVVEAARVQPGNRSRHRRPRGSSRLGSDRFPRPGRHACLPA